MNTTQTCFANADTCNMHSSYNEVIIGTMFMVGSFAPLLMSLFLSFCMDSYKTLQTGSSKLPVDIKDKYYDKVMRVMGNTRIKHRIILVRHGQSEHNQKYDGKDGEQMPTVPELDTNLTCAGLEQAKQVGEYLCSLKWCPCPDVIRISPMRRARQTAEPFIKKFFGVSQLHKFDGEPYNMKMCNCGGIGLGIGAGSGCGLIAKNTTRCMEDGMCMEVNTWGDQKLFESDMQTKQETYTGFVDRVRKWKRELEEDGLRSNDRMTTVVFTHSMVISELLNMIVSEKRETISDDMWSKTYWQVNHGSITCLDYTENGEWHVQAMNYTGHLDMYTGIKSPFV